MNFDLNSETKNLQFLEAQQKKTFKKKSSFQSQPLSEFYCFLDVTCGYFSGSKEVQSGKYSNEWNKHLLKTFYTSKTFNRTQ